MKSTIGAVLAGALMLLSTSAFAGEVDRREHCQQERITQGVRDGSLNRREAVRLERKESRIRREVRAERRENGGRLTQGERGRVNRQENRLSREIARDRHN
jgi:hypothetical protein